MSQSCLVCTGKDIFLGRVEFVIYIDDNIHFPKQNVVDYACYKYGRHFFVYGVVFGIQPKKN